MRPRFALGLAVAAGVVAVAAIAALSAAPRQATAGQQIYRPGQGVLFPTLLRQQNPEYPEAAMRAKIEGTVELEAVVLADGTVGDVRVVKSLDPTLGLDAEAVAVAKRWLFRPATRDGKPVPVYVTLVLEFRLDKTRPRQVTPGPDSLRNPPPPPTDDEFLKGVYPMAMPGLLAPKLLKRVGPRYTEEAMRARINGVVEVEAVVLPDGTVGRARVTKALDTMYGLDREALAAVEQWTFEAGRLNGQAVPVAITVELEFKSK